jgi:hypothetical protein
MERTCASEGFASEVPLIHTGLQPGGKAVTLVRNRFNDFHREAKPLRKKISERRTLYELPL